VIPTVLSIAGLDPSGGAGLAADLKTATMMGAYGMTALTTVTVQHPGAMEEVFPLDAGIVSAQVRTLLQHMPIGAIKIGLIGTTAIAEALIQILEETPVPVVLDPVSQSTSGGNMSHVDDCVLTQLLQRADVITPNTDELPRMIGNLNADEWASQNQTALFCTGGHGPPGPITDVLWLPDGVQREWSHPRIPTQNTHGTGCTISTAIAVGLAKGKTTLNAIDEAIAFTHQLVEVSAQGGLVAHNGPLLHFKMNK
jgi:hydroxymethylpyrimidine/phosphomethylpyrimidine kinase